MFVMMALFLRSDLIQQFEHWRDDVRWAGCALKYLLHPSLLLEMKDELLKSMIPLTDKDLFNFDLFNNPRYHPRNRVKFLSKLVFSTIFARSLLKVTLVFILDCAKSLIHRTIHLNFFKKDENCQSILTYVII